MRKFIINVNGNSYDVEVEEVGASGAPVVSVPAVSAAAPAPVAAAPAPAAPKATPAPAGAAAVTSPMPGTILDIKVAVGASVKRGDILCILEAMKMENEISAPSDGTVVAINVTKGASVNTGDTLISIG